MLAEQFTSEPGLEEITLCVEDVVDGILAHAAPSAAAKGLSLTIEWGDGVPRFVLGDPPALRDCLHRLVTNAIRFTEKGGLHVRVRFAGMENRFARIRFEVEDSGVGIA